MNFHFIFSYTLHCLTTYPGVSGHTLGATEVQPGARPPQLTGQGPVPSGKVISSPDSIPVTGSCNTVSIPCHPCLCSIKGLSATIAEMEGECHVTELNHESSKETDWGGGRGEGGRGEEGQRVEENILSRFNDLEAEIESVLESTLSGEEEEVEGEEEGEEGEVEREVGEKDKEGEEEWEREESIGKTLSAAHSGSIHSPHRVAPKREQLTPSQQTRSRYVPTRACVHCAHTHAWVCVFAKGLHVARLFRSKFAESQRLE